VLWLGAFALRFAWALRGLWCGGCLALGVVWVTSPVGVGWQVQLGWCGGCLALGLVWANRFGWVGRLWWAFGVGLLCWVMV
jgi:hypothetical protein